MEAGPTRPGLTGFAAAMDPAARRGVQEVGSLIFLYGPGPRDTGKTGTAAPSAKPPDSAIHDRVLDRSSYSVEVHRGDLERLGPPFGPTLTPRRPEIVDLRRLCGP